MQETNNIYEYSFFIMKHHICRIVAVFCFFLICCVCCVGFLGFGTAVLEYCFPGEVSYFSRWEIWCLWGILAGLSVVFLLSPLLLGIKRWYYRLVCGEEEDLSTIFYYLGDGSHYKKAICFQLSLLWKKGMLYLMVGVVFGTLYMGIMQLERIFSRNVVLGIVYGMSVVLYLLLMVVCVFWGFYRNLRYALADGLFFENPEGKIGDILSLSAQKMAHGRREWLKVYLSLLPFYLVSVLILPIMVLIPYGYLLMETKRKTVLLTDK